MNNIRKLFFYIYKVYFADHKCLTHESVIQNLFKNCFESYTMRQTRMAKRFYLLLLSILILNSGANAEKTQKLNKTFLYRQFDSKQGLLSNQISNIFQDSNGYLWVSNWHGISRFDGKTFKNFNDNDGLFANSCFDAIEYLPNHILIQHIKGISFLENQKITKTIAFPDTVKGTRIGKSICQQNTFFFFNCTSTVSEKKCHLFFDGSWHSIDQVFDQTVLTIIQPSAKLFYLVTTNKIYQFSGEKLVAIKNLKQNYRSYCIDDSGNCWGYSDFDSQFYLISDFEAQINEKPTGIFASNLFRQKQPDTFFVLPDQEGIVYFDDNYQLFLINQNRQYSLGRSFSLIRKLFIDQEKNLWVASEEGLFNFFRLDFERIKISFTDKSDMFWSIAHFGNNRIVAGRFGFGFIELKDSIWSPVKMNYTKDPSSEMETYSPFMGAITSAKDEAWFPVWRGLVKFTKEGQRESFPLTTTPEALYIDPKSPDTIFAAATNGLLIIEPNSHINFIGPSAGFAKIQNESIVRDKYNRFWLGSSVGPVQIFDGKKVLPTDQTPNIQKVISAQKDSKENLWFGTDDGLYYYDYTNFIQIEPELISNQIDLLIPYNDSIMIGIGYRKLVLINYRKKPFEIQVHDELELGVMQNSYMIDNQGYVWFSTMYDLIRFYPLKMFRHYSWQLPKPYISSVDFSSDNVHWNTYIPEIYPNYRNNNLRFNFSAMVFKNQEVLKYRYSLENFDLWSEPTSNREVFYTNLNPGKYRFMVQCSIDGKNWSEVSYSDSIVIQPAWHQLLWIRIILVLLLVVIVAGIIFKVNNEYNRRKIRHLTEQKKLNKLQLQLVRSKQIPHFSGNALSNIEHYIFQANLREANKYLSMFSRLLNFTLQDADKAARTLKTELELIKLYLELEVMRFDHAISYQIEIDEKVDQNILMPNMMLHTLVENAVKHGLRNKKGKGMIRISANNIGHLICLSVEDNGIGRKKAVLMETSGSGTGLKILNEQIDIYNQFNENKINIEINDLEDSTGEATGTRFSIYIPDNYSFSI